MWHRETWEANKYWWTVLSEGQYLKTGWMSIEYGIFSLIDMLEQLKQSHKGLLRISFPNNT